MTDMTGWCNRVRAVTGQGIAVGAAFSGVVSVLLGLGWGAAGARELPDPPRAPAAEDFAALRRASPFRRTLRIDETYALRGVAQVDGAMVATLFNRETEKSVVVSDQEANESGLRLVGVNGGWDLTGVAATISFAGEETELRYEPERVAPAASGRGPRGAGGGDGRGGDRGGDGQRRGPSKEDIERYRSLSDENKQKLRAYIGEVMRKYPDMPRSERGNLIRGAMIRLSDGRDISVDSAGPSKGPSGGGR